MLTGIAQSIAVALFLIIFWIIDTIMFRQHSAQQQDSGQSWSYRLMVNLIVIGIILQPVILPFLSLHIEARWGLIVQGIGAMMGLLALALFTWSRVHLREFYAEDAIIQDDHQVIDTGPYGLMRHPSFVAFMMIVVALFLIIPAIHTFILIFPIVIDFYQAAIRDEELLAKELPAYNDYMQRVPRWPWSTLTNK